MVNEAVNLLSKQIERSYWARASKVIGTGTTATDVETFSVLLGEHAPPEPERFKPMVEDSYKLIVEQYVKSISDIGYIPDHLQETAYRIHGSRLETIELIPKAESLDFQALVETHDLLVSWVAKFHESGNYYQNGDAL